MTVFLLIIILAAGLQLAAKAGLNPQKRFRDNARIATGIFFIFTGLSHFLVPGMFMKMMPPVLPAPLFLIYLSGVFEILGGIGLMLARTKKAAAIGLILLLLAVFPANIYVAVNNVQLGGFMSEGIYQWLRLPMQLVLMWWVWWTAEIHLAQRRVQTI
jgi:uncharacterized membrane protein